MTRSLSTASLRLGVMVAVQDAGSHILLMRRGDLDVWALPGGRLDDGESLTGAAVRECREETGLDVHVTGLLGLYFLRGFGRVNVLVCARPDRAVLQAAGAHVPGSQTEESRGAAWFPVDALPAMPLAVIAADAAAHRPALTEIVTPPLAYARLRAALMRRYALNALRGRPEPRFPVFDSTACAVVVQAATGRVLTTYARAVRSLPRLPVDAHRPPWDHLREALRSRFGVDAALRWAGVRQQAGTNRLEFVFHGLTDAVDLFRGGAWSSPRLDGLTDLDYGIVDRTLAAEGVIWMWDDTPAVLPPGSVIAP